MAEGGQSPKEEPPKLSLLAQFEDMMRIQDQILYEMEEDEALVEFVLKELDKEPLCDNTHELKQLEEEILEEQKEIALLETRLKHAKMLEKVKLEELKTMEDQNVLLDELIKQMKEVLLSGQTDLSDEIREKLDQVVSDIYIEESKLSLSGISFDETQEHLKSYANSEQHCSEYEDQPQTPLASKNQHDLDDVFLPEEIGDTQEKIHVQNRSNDTPIRRLSSFNRPHEFCSKTVIKQESCSACGSKIGFCKQALKCQNCRAICHNECIEEVPLPCIATVLTPKSQAALGNLADFASTTCPMIPPLIVHCVKEIEARGLNEIGIYRVSGSEREVKELQQKFIRGKHLPCLNKVSIHVVCGTIKEFLRSLSEPLLTRSLRGNFISAAEISSGKVLAAMKQAISLMPLPNRDTLAFLILHLISVSESPACKMPINNLEKVFGPTIIGYSAGDHQEVDLLKETNEQISVMRMLLKTPSDYWATIVDTDKKMPFVTKHKKNSVNQIFSLNGGVTVEKVPLRPRGKAITKKTAFTRNSSIFK